MGTFVEINERVRFLVESLQQTDQVRVNTVVVECLPNNVMVKGLERLLEIHERHEAVGRVFTES